MTARAFEQAAEIYGPLVAAGEKLLELRRRRRCHAARHYFAASADLVDRHRVRIAALPAIDPIGRRSEARRGANPGTRAAEGQETGSIDGES